MIFTYLYPKHTADAIQMSSWVASAVCIEFATSWRRLPTKIWKLNMLRIYPVELSCVSGVYTPVGCRDPVYDSAACDWRRKLETGSWLTTGAYTPPTRRNSTSLSANCSDSSRLSPTSCEFNTHRRRNSTRQLSCVCGVYWALLNYITCVDTIILTALQPYFYSSSLRS